MKIRLAIIGLVVLAVVSGASVAYAWLSASVSAGVASVSTGTASLSVDTVVTAAFEFTNLIPTAGGPGAAYAATKQLSLSNGGDAPLSIALCASLAGFVGAPPDLASKLDMQVDEQIAGAWVTVWTGTLADLAVPQAFNSSFVAPAPQDVGQSLRMTMWLDSSADQSYQALSGTLTLRFQGTQSNP